MKKRALSSLSTYFSILLTAVVLVTACGNNGSSDSETSNETGMQDSDFQISLAQWSLHRKYFGDIQARGGWEWFGKTLMTSPDDLLLEGQDPMDFPAIAADYDIKTIELVNTFYYSKANDLKYWKAFKQKCEEAGVQVGLIMCDALGDLGNADAAARKQTVENHYAWVDIAAYLGAKTIRVNAAGQGTAEEVANNAIDGLSELGKYGATKGINIVVENHGGYSSNGAWLADIMKRINMENVGTLPDFGNFCIENGPDGCVNEYDRYKGIAELMPYAKAVSAKSHMFDKDGNETRSDFARIMKIVKDAGFKGNIGIEYEGAQLTEDEGIKATKALLEKTFAGLE